MSATAPRLVATLNFGGDRRAYTLGELHELRASIEPMPVEPRPALRIVHQANFARRPDDRRLSKYRQVSALKQRVHAEESAAIREALTTHAGGGQATAAALGISLRSLWYKCRLFGIKAAAFRAEQAVSPLV